MNFKIIETAPEYPDVLLYRDRDEEGIEVVNVLAIGMISGDEDQFAIKTVKFEEAEAAQQFIQDFSQISAERFCRRHGVEYS